MKRRVPGMEKGIELAARLLERGWQRAVEAGAPLWRHPVHWSELLQESIPEEVIRELAERELIAHHRNGRSVPARHQPAGEVFGPRSSFVLTLRGIRWVQRLLTEERDGDDLFALADPIVPQWQPGRRRLLVAGLVVREYRREPRAQGAILMALEAAGWEEQISDPQVGLLANRLVELS
jgi:hypothetical protein